MDGMALPFGQTHDVPDSVINQLNNEIGRAPSDLDGNEEMVDFLDDVYKKCISNEIRERRREKKQRDQEALVISQEVTKIPKITDILISEQDEQDLSQSYEASSESIRSASCGLIKATANSSRSESCDTEELKSDQHEVIAKLDKNIIVEQEISAKSLAFNSLNESVDCMFDDNFLYEME
ncbi:hypothetical protein RhiirA4_421159 [Rhizophagus irregularis]|uniref:Uncharacterized protein n=1 Tax=Rhizophagus irregularis TaxID=588596 RepID=A0A2I1GKI9_9GLOM|nr:hypothetical protein RhiirA4_421159 [Rhizophagus irregularis]